MIDRVGEVVVTVQSQAGQFGGHAAQDRPGKVKALVLLEPAAVGDPGKTEALRGLPVLVVYGDLIDQDARWPMSAPPALPSRNARARPPLT